MTIEELGNIGEFIAAIATVATLVYLALQIRQNTSTTKISASQSVLASMNSALQVASSSGENAKSLILGQSDFDSLSEDEQAQFLVWIFSWFRTLEQAHFYNNRGYLDDELWEGQVNHLRQMIRSPGVSRWWQTRKSYFNEAFQKFVDTAELYQGDVTHPRGAIEAMRKQDAT